MHNRGVSDITGKINLVMRIIHNIAGFKSKINHRMERRYSPTLIALVSAAAAALLMISMLFLPNYLGVANDGSYDRVMNAAGIYHIENQVDDIYNNYFIKTYSNVLSGYHQSDYWFNSQVLIVKAAVYFDDIITGDRFFDIRFLGLIYGILYVPAIYLLIKQACMRVKSFSEGIVIGVLGVLVFADVAYVSYFNSFYPEALWLISLMYCVGAAVSFQEDKNGYIDFSYLILFIISGVILMTSRSQCAVIGILLAVYCLKLVFVRRNWMWGVICVLCGLGLSFISITCMLQMESDFNDTSKFHAMTRGVLFQSDNPQKTLEEFNIPASYEMLTDASGYDYLPLVKPTDPIMEEFLSMYTITDIAAYYVRHPGKFFSMMDVSIKSCFGIRRDFCGNYEKSVGLPEKARSIFWSMWSTFKVNSAPKTIGYLLVLCAAVFLLFGKGYSLRPSNDRRSTVFLDIQIVVLLICISQSAITIVNSGDAEMIKHCFLVSYAIDFLTYFVLAEIVHKVNIF